MPVRDPLLQPVAQFMQVMPRMRAFGHAVSVEAKALHEGNGYQEQESKPEVIRG